MGQCKTLKNSSGKLYRSPDGIVVETLFQRPDGSRTAIVQIPRSAVESRDSLWVKDCQEAIRILLTPMGLKATLGWSSLYDVAKRQWVIQLKVEPIEGKTA